MSFLLDPCAMMHVYEHVAVSLFLLHPQSFVLILAAMHNIAPEI